MKKITLYILVILSLTITSCHDQLELTPAQSLNTEEALVDLDGLETALNGAYNALQSVNYYGREYMVLPEIEGNLAYLTINNSNRFTSAYQYSWTIANGDIAGVWNTCYTAILRVNNVLSSIDDIDGDTTRKNQIKGEALAIRALAYFDLVRFFAKPYTRSNPSTDPGVPVTLVATLDELARNSIEDVYRQVVSDLTEAKGLMTGTDRMRMNSMAAEALLARVYLYQGKNADAISSATNVIESGSFSLSNDYDAIFSGPGATSEDIFTLEFLATETRGADNHGQIYNPSGYGDIRVSEDLRSLYEAGDQRANLIYLFSDGEYYTSKYDEQDGVPGLVSPKIIRFAEIYLIRAEARFNNGDGAGALEDINTLRTIRGATSLSSISVLRDILDERQRELVFEGHTTFDLYRNNLSMIRNQCNTGIELNAVCRIDPDDHRTVHPIPEDEMNVNQQMIQNNGY